MAASPDPALIDLYVYYRVHASHAQAHLAQAQALLAELRARLGVQGRLARRPQAKDGLHTWMLSFVNLPAGQEAAVTAALAAHPTPIDGERHTERFIHLA